MKRRGGRTMVFDKKDAERQMSETMKMEDLCSKLTSLIPQEYRLDTASQGSSDMPSQLINATTYIKDLRERVEKLKQMKYGHAKIQRTTRCCGNSNVTNTAAATGSCGPHDIAVQFSGATHFDVNFTMTSRESVELHRVIRTIEQDQRIELIEANSCFVDDSKIVYMLKCKAISSEAVLDASMVRRLLTESLAEP
ncbi:unnamed protein product [Alopecurus aequalis]